MDALDSQLCAELPLEYHALYLAQRELKISGRRDAAWGVPLPPTPPPPLRKNAGAGARARHEQEQLAYETQLRDVWWPEFEHHAFMVVMNRHTHVHCATCLKGKRGKTGCRMCALWAHGNNCTTCRELRTIAADETAPPGEEFRCQVCYADGALSDPSLTPAESSAAVLKADAVRDIFYTVHEPSAEVEGRILAVELQRRSIPTPDDEAMGALADDQGGGVMGAAPAVNLLAQIVREGREARLAGRQPGWKALPSLGVRALMRSLMDGRWAEAWSALGLGGLSHCMCALARALRRAAAYRRGSGVGAQDA